MILEKERVTPLSLSMILECGSIWSGTWCNDILAGGSSCCRGGGCSLLGVFG